MVSALEIAAGIVTVKALIALGFVASFYWRVHSEGRTTRPVSRWRPAAASCD